MVDYIYMTANLVILCPLCGKEALWDDKEKVYICTNPECAYYKPIEDKWIEGTTPIKLIGSFGRRGFELVSYARPTAKLPVRADNGSAGYDFFVPETVVLLPGEVRLVWTDIKAFMEPDEVLLITIRSSLAKDGLFIANSPGVVDSSYYNNPSNEGNIGLLLYNSSALNVTIKEGARVAQGIFMKYLVAENDNVLKFSRTGGCGSSGK